MQDTEGFARHRLRSTPHGGQLCRGISGSFGLESVAALAWNQRQLCYGISGSIRVEQVAALPWNWWQDSPGIGGSFGVEYAITGDVGIELATIETLQNPQLCAQ